MKRRQTWTKSVLLVLCLLALLFTALTGCTIEFPDEVAADDPLSVTDSAEPAPSGPADSAASSGAGSAGSGTAEGGGTQETGSAGSTTAAGEGKAPASSPSSPTSPTPSTSSASSAAPTTTPAPVEPEDMVVDEETRLTCTLSIRCDTILDNMDLFNKDKLGVLPEDGVIYAERTVTFYEGESVFDVLLRETKKNRIHMEFERTPIYNSNYIEGINNLYEKDCGEGSGWMYRVNGWFPNYGCSRYPLKDGDRIEWLYTCDLGYDLGRTGTWDDLRQ